MHFHIFINFLFYILYFNYLFTYLLYIHMFHLFHTSCWFSITLLLNFTIIFHVRWHKFWTLTIFKTFDQYNYLTIFGIFHFFTSSLKFDNKYYKMITQSPTIYWWFVFCFLPCIAFILIKFHFFIFLCLFHISIIHALIYQ